MRGGSHFCQAPKGRGSGVFLLKRKGGPTLFWEKNTKIPQPSPPKKKRTFPKSLFESRLISLTRFIRYFNRNHCRKSPARIGRTWVEHHFIKGQKCHVETNLTLLTVGQSNRTKDAPIRRKSTGKKIGI